MNYQIVRIHMNSNDGREVGKMMSYDGCVCVCRLPTICKEQKKEKQKKIK